MKTCVKCCISRCSRHMYYGVRLRSNFVRIPFLKVLRWNLSEAAENQCEMVEIWCFKRQNIASFWGLRLTLPRTLPLKLIIEMEENNWKYARNGVSQLSISRPICNSISIALTTSLSHSYRLSPVTCNQKRQKTSVKWLKFDVSNFSMSSASGGFAPTPPRTLSLKLIRNERKLVKICAKWCVSI